MEVMASVRAAQMSVQSFLSMYDYPSALDVIATTQLILTQDLQGITCFRHLPTQVSQIESNFIKMCVLVE
jgi:vacuolar protein sorting-associated protein 54